MGLNRGLAGFQSAAVSLDGPGASPSSPRRRLTSPWKKWISEQRPHGPVSPIRAANGVKNKGAILDRSANWADFVHRPA